jgi:single-stranded DNA-binding protein
MSARVLLTGAIGKPAEIRTSKNGNQFATLTIRENVNGATRWWQAIAFSETVISIVKEMAVGEPVSVAGDLGAELYSPNGGEPRVNLRVIIDAVLGARQPPKAKMEGDSRKPKPTVNDRVKSPSTDGRSIAARSWAAPTDDDPSRGNAPFSDSIPFMYEWR